MQIIEENLKHSYSLRFDIASFNKRLVLENIFMFYHLPTYLPMYLHTYIATYLPMSSLYIWKKETMKNKKKIKLNKNTIDIYKHSINILKIEQTWLKTISDNIFFLIQRKKKETIREN